MMNPQRSRVLRFTVRLTNFVSSAVLDLGSGAGHFVKYLPEERVGSITHVDSSEDMLFRDANDDTMTASYKLRPVCCGNACIPCVAILYSV
jgi:trans-aconitate methyltransferase